jgi:hypothetical protein
MIENDPFFEHLNPRFVISTNMRQTFFNKISIGCPITQNFMLIPNSLKCAQNNVPKKSISKKQREKVHIRKTQTLHSFFAYNFIIEYICEPISMNSELAENYASFP